MGYQSCHLRHTNIVLSTVSFFRFKFQLLYVFALDQQSYCYYRWDNRAVQGIQEIPGIHWWEMLSSGYRGPNKERCCALPFTHQEGSGLWGGEDQRQLWLQWLRDVGVLPLEILMLPFPPCFPHPTLFKELFLSVVMLFSLLFLCIFSICSALLFPLPIFFLSLSFTLLPLTRGSWAN